MTLNSQSNYPSTRCYVLKLHRDADPENGEIFGRVESLYSAARVDFRSGEELLAWLVQDAIGRGAGPQAVARGDLAS